MRGLIRLPWQYKLSSSPSTNPATSIYKSIVYKWAHMFSIRNEVPEQLILLHSMIDRPYMTCFRSPWYCFCWFKSGPEWKSPLIKKVFLPDFYLQVGGQRLGSKLLKQEYALKNHTNKIMNSSRAQNFYCSMATNSWTKPKLIFRHHD